MSIQHRGWTYQPEIDEELPERIRKVCHYAVNHSTGEEILMSAPSAYRDMTRDEFERRIDEYEAFEGPRWTMPKVKVA